MSGGPRPREPIATKTEPSASSLRTSAFRILPLTDLDAHELVRSILGSPSRFGHRGAPPVEVAALEDLLVRVAHLVDEIPEVSEMDLNPVIVSTSGAVAVDAKVRLTPGQARPELAARRLRTP